MQRCSLYIIRSDFVFCDGEDLFKVGISSNVSKRLAGLQTASPARLRIETVITLPSRDCALSIERRMHEELSCSGLCGEWFSTSLTGAKSLLDDECARYWIERNGNSCGLPAWFSRIGLDPTSAPLVLASRGWQ